MSETTRAHTQSHDTARVEEKRRHPEAPLGGHTLLLDNLLGSSAVQPQVDRHAALVGDPRFSYSANADQKAQIVTELQSRYGNAYVQELLDRRVVQARPAVSSPDDEYEKEADAVAVATAFEQASDALQISMKETERAGTKPKESNQVASKPNEPSKRPQKKEMREHSQLVEHGCCDQGAKMMTPQKAKAIFDTKTAKDLMSVDLSVSPQEREDGSYGPANFVRGVLSTSVIDSLEQLLRTASEQGAKVVCDDSPGPDGIPRTYRDLDGQWIAFHKKSDANHQPGSMVAMPGTSNHGTGRAIDFSGGTDFAWLLENAANYGWVNYPAENWHYDHVSTPNIIRSHRGKLKSMIAKGQPRSHSGRGKKQISEKEKSTFGAHYDMAEALEWNEARNYLPNTWLKVQEYAGMPMEHRTGMVDWRTVKAVMAWQKCQGLKADGKVGSATLMALGL